MDPRYPFRTAILAGLTLSQVGEFAVYLSRTGIEHGLLSNDSYRLFLAVSVVTMAATPFIISGASPRSRFAVAIASAKQTRVGIEADHSNTAPGT